MVDAITVRSFTKGERADSPSHLIQTKVSWVKAEADRNLWPDTGREVIGIVIEFDDGAGKGWQALGGFGAEGGAKVGRDGNVRTASSVRINRPLEAGALIRARVEAKEGLNTAVRLTWG